MKVIFNFDKFDAEDFEAFQSCFKKRKEILKVIKKFEENKLVEFTMYSHECGDIYLVDEELEKNKEFVKKSLELMLETNKRDIEDLIERLGIEDYEE